MGGTADDERALAALRLLLPAARRSPLPAVAQGAHERWHRYGPLLLPSALDPGALPDHLAGHRGPGPGDAVPAPGGRSGPPRRRAAPHAVLLSRIATDRTRLRSFPLDADRRPVGALTVHARRPLRRARLVGAARAQHAAGARGSALRVPAVLGAGRSRGGEWLAEEHVEGRHLEADELLAAAGEVLSGLTAHWAAAGAGREVRRASPDAVDAVELLLRSQAAADVGAAQLGAALRALARRDVAMAVGSCHGDPVAGNVLRSSAGDLVLIDWEHAGPGLLAHDLVKVALGVPRAEDAAALLAAAAPTALSPAGSAATAPWQDQVALTLVEWLAGWRQQAQVHGRSGRAAPFERRLRRRLALLRLVLEG